MRQVSDTILYNYLAGFAAPDDFIFALSNRGNERLLLNVVDHLLPGSFRSKHKKSSDYFLSFFGALSSNALIFVYFHRHLG
jgi:hypothetical protein